jgi:arylsulfatase A-like enzyme/Flp pilus assembly protein TadD
VTCIEPGGASVLAHASWILATLAFLLGACGAPPPPHVVIVTFDTTRYDRLGFTGDPGARTPTLDALAARGLSFDRAFAAVALTLPSHTTILSGVPPLSHGVHNNGRFEVPESLETLAERLAAAGFETAAFVSAFVLDSRFRLDQGFEVYGDDTLAAGDLVDFTVPSRPGEEVTDEALAWLEKRDSTRPFLLWAHYYDPHLPHEPRPSFGALRDPYAAEIAYADAQLARLLEGVEQAAGERATLVVFTSDHGEAFGEHGEPTHGVLAYDATLHVPLVLAGPGIPRGVRSEVLARHEDIVPTVLRLVGLPVPEDLPGRDLVEAARRGAQGGDDAVFGYFESRGPHFELGWAEIQGVRSRRWKFTATPQPQELYDVLADPRELQNRIGVEPEVHQRMEQAYGEIQRTFADSARPSAMADLDPEEEEHLAALGYVAAPKKPPRGIAPDPRPLVGVWYWVEGARAIAQAGDWERAIETLETLKHSASVRSVVLRTLAPLYEVLGRYDAAEAAYRDYIELTGSREAHLALARVALSDGAPERALDNLDRLSAGGPAVEFLRARALMRLGRVEEARAAVDAAFSMPGSGSARLHRRAALVVDVAPLEGGEEELRGLLAEAPEDSLLESWLGYYLAVWGRPEQGGEARDLLESAAVAAAESPQVQSNLAWGAHQLGYPEIALTALRRALELDSRRFQDRARLGLILAQTGDVDGAKEALRTALQGHPGAAWADRARRTLDSLEGHGEAESEVGVER